MVFVEKIIVSTNVLWLTTPNAPVVSVVDSSLSTQKRLRSISAPTVAGLWEDKEGRMLETQVPGSMTVEDEMKEAMDFAKGKQDVITLAKTLREGWHGQKLFR